MANSLSPRKDHIIPDTICDYYGVIRDEEIRKAINAGYLFQPETADLARVRQASYELRLSANVEFLIVEYGTHGTSTAKYERPASGIGDVLAIQPGNTVKVETIESLDLPTDVLAHVTAVGNIYKLGLSPETTYADPGFDGPFYLILSNYSGHVVSLRVGQPIARIEFSRLARATMRPHPGAKKITEPELWPQRVNRRQREELRLLGVDGILAELAEKDPPHWEHAFVATEVKATADRETAGIRTYVEELQKRIDELAHQVNAANERDARDRKLVRWAFIGFGAILGIFAVDWLWPHLPDAITKGVADGVAKGLGAFLGGLIATLLNKFAARKTT